MSIIGVGGEKGGCGKTTVATNIAAFLAFEGHSVGLLDADAKPGASSWGERRADNKEELPAIYHKRTRGDIDATITDLSEKYDYVVVDCGGYDSKELRYTVALSNLFIAPFNPSVYDTETATEIDALIDHGRVFNPTLVSCSVICGASGNNKSIENKKAFANLKATKHIKPLVAVLHQLTVFRSSARYGMGVIDDKNARAKMDIRRVWEELCLIQK